MSPNSETLSDIHRDLVNPRQLRKIWQDCKNKVVDVDATQIGLVGTFTVEPLIPYLGSYLVLAGQSAPGFSVAEYNQLISVCLNPDSFFPEPPDVLVLLWRMEDLAIDSTIDAIQSAVDTYLDTLLLLREQYDGTVIVALPPVPASEEELKWGFSRPSPLLHLWHKVNAELIARIASLQRVYSVDMAQVALELGLENALDRRKSFMYRQPFTEQYFAALASRIGRIIRAQKYEPKKCIVLDCDNTLWGGIVGEVGISGLILGQDFPGSAYQKFQGTCKALKESGVFLALNSKNDFEIVREVFQSHSGMLLKEEDISVFKVNWDTKSKNLKEIAAELNIGLDSLVFIDDNPFELAEVLSVCPGVTCLQVPEELADLPTLLNENHFLFDRLEITEDDLNRIDRMKGEARRIESQACMSESEFMDSLNLKICVYTPQPADLARVSQLINKTNQFNLTTKRYNQDEIVYMMADPSWRILALSAQDKFGDYGLVGVAMLHNQEMAWRIDNILLSCRVLKRGVETALLSAVIEDLLHLGCNKLFGLYIPTQKNKMCKSFYEEHYFIGIEQSGYPFPDVNLNGTYWAWDFSQQLSSPSHIQLLRAHPLNKE